MRGALAALALVACGTAPDGEPAARASTPASETAPPLTPRTDAECEGCHVREAREWRGSAHRWAFTDEVFQAEWSGDPSCVRCHAPLADAERPSGRAAENGVSCVVCHGAGDTIAATHAAPEAPHAVTFDPTLGTSEACAGCHDFAFALVAPTPYHDADPLQATLTEGRAVPERGSCQDCHARTEDARVSHTFPGAREPSLLARALDVEATARRVDGHTTVTLRLRSNAGHAVPTGDMFRRLRVSASAADGPETSSVVLTRRFELVGGERRDVADDRVMATGERVVTLEVPTGGPVRWRIEWQALDPALAEARWLPAADVTRLVAEGAL